ncbi:hypothetical protein U9M48_023204 [Paspalum notatum var. saurae]|uniref:Uncharacterized protein n=1 Tax=Paspalum notatum var. saurae TaxID=547442 RepID=A0AAQ3WVP0_PASNO
MQKRGGGPRPRRQEPSRGHQLNSRGRGGGILLFGRRLSVPAPTFLSGGGRTGRQAGSLGIRRGARAGDRRTTTYVSPPFELCSEPVTT